MSLSRCAYRDVHRRRRSKRYTIGGKWRKKFIQYKIKYTPKLDRRYVDSKIAMAFMIWSPSSGITFVKRDKGPVDIIIEFGSSELYSDKIVLANTKSAGIASAGITIRINDEVLWEENFKSDAPNLFQTVAHEVGHAIGLGHTDVLGAMMYPVYGYGRKVYSLHQDDIRGAKDAYNFQVVSYPGRFQYRQFRKTITKSFDDLRSKMKHSFGKDIKPLNIPEEFFSKGF
ncbi:72 kDa type IV collagenase-like [Colias croceus]|uniref:72 kDa type IV collagenase-like n=1 Tax=Colias crocea TaxID=72248 RepID=UPI001E280098|nr:72 kDa type IV collagenase-like [Colias croceus]